MKRLFPLLGAGVLVTACTAQTPSEDTSNVGEDLLTPLATYPYCWAQIERIYPSTSTLLVGTPIDFRANPTLVCPPGVSNTVVYRFYITGPSGTFSPEAPGAWSTTRVVPWSTSALLPGRYRIYLQSLPSSMLAAWEAGDPTAIAAVHTSGNTYTSFVAAQWSTSSWSACSSTCGPGTQTRTVTCVDPNGNVVADSYCTSPMPATTQACEGDICTPDTVVVNGSSQAISSIAYSRPGWWEIDNAASHQTWSYEVDFAAKPMSPAVYATFDDSPSFSCGPTQATVWIWNATDEWWTETTSAPVNVVTGNDGKLHITFEDAALPGTTGTLSVKLDVTVP